MNAADFSNTTLEELKKLNHDKVKNFNREEFLAYHKRSIKLGNKYMFAGEVEGGHAPIVYGTSTARLTKDNDGNWGMGDAAGLVPFFDTNPIMLNKEKFEEEMKKLGVSEKVINEFVGYKPNMSNF